MNLKNDIRNLSLEELEKWLVSINEPKYRAGQVFLWLYKKKLDSINKMANLPSSLKNKLEEEFTIYQPVIVKKQVSAIDGTEKFLLLLIDGELIETVIIPAGERVTVCLSTQVGCRYKCKFCASGLYGFKRNLSQSEILSQLITVQKEGHNITNVVFMGIGEPLDNYDNLVSSIKIINDKNGFNIGARKITISTAGIPDKIKELSNIGIQIELSVSLHAPDSKKRDALMPINKLYPLSEVLKAVEEFYIKTKRLVTFEYVLIKGVNDSTEDAFELVKLLKGLKCKINLIPYSPAKETTHQTPDEKEVQKFRDILDSEGIPATIRFSKGADISAACGQLRISSQSV